MGHSVPSPWQAALLRETLGTGGATFCQFPQVDQESTLWCMRRRQAPGRSQYIATPSDEVCAFGQPDGRRRSPCDRPNISPMKSGARDGRAALGQRRWSPVQTPILRPQEGERSGHCARRELDQREEAASTERRAGATPHRGPARPGAHHRAPRARVLTSSGRPHARPARRRDATRARRSRPQRVSRAARRQENAINASGPAPGSRIPRCAPVQRARQRPPGAARRCRRRARAG